jgi:hypothetical protein
MSKTPRTFRFSDETIKRLELIAEKENRSLTGAVEFMISEKADYYSIKILKKKDTPSGAFPYNGFNNNKNK